MPTNTIANHLFGAIERSRTLDQLLLDPLDWARGAWGVQNIVVLAASKGSWKRIVQSGRAAAIGPDSAHAGECLDSRRAKSAPPWYYVPIPSTTHPDLVVCCHGLPATSDIDSITESIGWIGQTIDLWHRQLQKARDVVRLNQILEVAANWHSHQDLDRLLQDMAQAAINLLRSDRASIFLWDKPARELVGHPALGIEGKPLRIADDKGIAGAVLKSQQPRRWDRSDPTDEVDRRVDTSSGYRTDSLLAVPLNDHRGKPMGVFEVINHAEGRFDLQDENDLIELARHASAALSNTQTLQRLMQTRDRLTQDAQQQVQLIGDSPEMQSLKATVTRVGDTDLAVLLLGENGTGKEVVSRQIHYQSKRRYEPFIAVNCAAITETLLESELFGHEKGAFTDAHETRTGKFELASGGTLFLDEIGDMSLAGQAKLLRVLEEKVVVRVGGSSPIPVNVRVIAATNQNLVDLVRHKRFREDLYFRLTVVTMSLPPIRQRGNDVLELADFFLTMFCNKIGRSKPTLSANAKRRLLTHDWPGNVRELRNIIERIAYLTNEEVIEESQIDFVRSPRNEEGEGLGAIDLSKTLSDATADFQIRYIEQQIKANNRNVTHAAERMGLQRSNLYRKMKQLGMKSPDGE
jgi:transcriptional regulator with GAF, ATPase, and Fis domain